MSRLFFKNRFNEQENLKKKRPNLTRSFKRKSDPIDLVIGIFSKAMELDPHPLDLPYSQIQSV